MKRKNSPLYHSASVHSLKKTTALIFLYILSETLDSYLRVCVYVCACQVASVVSDLLWPYGLLPARLLCPEVTVLIILHFNFSFYGKHWECFHIITCKSILLLIAAKYSSGWMYYTFSVLLMIILIINSLLLLQ